MTEPQQEMEEQGEEEAVVVPLKPLKAAAPPAAPPATTLVEFGVGAVAVGAALRKVRETKGLSREEMSRKTRIRLAILDAIEQGDTAQLPEEAFALGFIRLYARQLGLPEEEVVHRYKASLKPREEHVSMAPPTESRQRPAKWLVLLGLILFGAGFAYHEKLLTYWPFKKTQSDGDSLVAKAVVNSMPAPREETHAAPQLPAPTKPASATPAPSASSPPATPAAPLPAGAPAPGTAVKPSLTPVLPPAAASAPPVSGSPPAPVVAAPAVAVPAAPAAAAPDSSATPAQTDAQAAVAPPVEAKPAEAKPAEGKLPELKRWEGVGDPNQGEGVILTATDKVWLQIKEINGEFFKEIVLKPGQTFKVYQGEKYALWAGNTSGLKIKVGSKEVSGLGGGKVIKNLNLAPQGLLERSAKAGDRSQPPGAASTSGTATTPADSSALPPGAAARGSSRSAPKTPPAPAAQRSQPASDEPPPPPQSGDMDE